MSNYRIMPVSKNIPSLNSEQTKHGYIIFNDCLFSHWDELMEQWIINIESYYNRLGYNAAGIPYIDNEMCNSGMLMSAAWMIGGVALCEKNITLMNPKRTGRLDLIMKLPKCDEIEIIEAKHTIHDRLIKKTGKFKGQIDKYDYNYLKQTVEKRLATIDIDYPCRKIAVLFYTPKKVDLNYDHVSPSRKPVYTDGWDLTAWCFPRQGYEYPGVILSAKNVV